MVEARPRAPGRRGVEGPDTVTTRGQVSSLVSTQGRRGPPGQRSRDVPDRYWSPPLSRFSPSVLGDTGPSGVPIVRAHRVRRRVGPTTISFLPSRSRTPVLTHVLPTQVQLECGAAESRDAVEVAPVLPTEVVIVPIAAPVAERQTPEDRPPLDRPARPRTLTGDEVLGRVVTHRPGGEGTDGGVAGVKTVWGPDLVSGSTVPPPRDPPRHRPYPPRP